MLERHTYEAQHLLAVYAAGLRVTSLFPSTGEYAVLTCVFCQLLPSWQNLSRASSCLLSYTSLMYINAEDIVLKIYDIVTAKLDRLHKA